MIVLRGRTAAAKREEMEDRPIRKLIEAAAAKEERAAAKAAAKGEKVVKKVVEVRVEKVAVGAARPCGHVSAKGLVCKRPAPCGSHQKRLHAEAKKAKALALEAVLDELGVPADDGGDGFLQALSEAPDVA